MSTLNKNLACCELHTNSYIIDQILSKYSFTIIQYNNAKSYELTKNKIGNMYDIRFIIFFKESELAICLCATLIRNKIIWFIYCFLRLCL